MDATVRGKKFPLCLTVQALDDITKQVGDLDKLGAYLDGDGISEMVSRSCWLLAVLIREGEHNRAVLEDEKPQLVPTQADLSHMLMPVEVLELRAAVIGAVAEGLYQSVKAGPSKNGENHAETGE